MPIVQAMDGQVLDGVYVIETQTPPSIQGIQTGIVKMVGDFSRGIPGAVYSISDYPTAVRNLGPSLSTINGPLNMQALANQKAGGAQVVPVFGTTATSASVTLLDTAATPGNVLILTAAQVHPQTGVITAMLGSDPNLTFTATASNSTGSTFDLSITDTRSGITETYKALTLATMVATINAATKIVVASLPATPSALLPKAATYQFAGGTNGTPGDSDFVGTIDGSGNRTGLVALEPITGNFVFVANQYSPTINAAVAAHANSYNCQGLVCDAPGSTVAVLAAANTYAQDNVEYCEGWRTMYDADTATTRQIAPTALVAGMAAQLPVWKSWGNKAIYGTLGAVTPRSSTDLATLQQAGIICVGDGIPRGGCGTFSGVASDGSDAYVRRMKYFIELSVMSSLGWAVEEMQSNDPNDQLRKDVKGSLDAFLAPMAKPLDKSQRAIDSYLTVCNTTNNPPATVAAGQLNISGNVKLLGAAKQIVFSANISTTAVTVTTQAA